MGAEKDGMEVDQWAIGALFAEMLLGSPIFYGFDPANQLFTMFKVLGFPSRSQLSYLGSGYDQLVLPKGQMRATLRDKLPCLGEEGHDLLRRLLDWCPNSRISAAQALQHPYLASRTVPQRDARANIVQFLIHKASDLSGISQEVSHLSDEDEDPVGVNDSGANKQYTKYVNGELFTNTEQLSAACNVYTVLDVPLASGTSSPKPATISVALASSSCASSSSLSDSSSHSRASRKPTAAALPSKGPVVPDSPLRTAEPPNIARTTHYPQVSSAAKPVRCGEETSRSLRVLLLGAVDATDESDVVRVSGVGDDDGHDDQAAWGKTVAGQNRMGQIVQFEKNETLLSPAAALRNSGLIQLRVPNWEGMLEEAGIGASMATTLSQHSSQS